MNTIDSTNMNGMRNYPTTPPSTPPIQSMMNNMNQNQNPKQHPYQNQQAPHQQAPHQQAPHQQAPHQQAPHQQAPHQQAPHQQAPHQQAPHQQAPHQQAPHQQAPHQQVPHQQVPHQQVPHQQAPHQQAPHQQAPHQQVPHQQVPHQQAPQQSVPPKQNPYQQQTPYSNQSNPSPTNETPSNYQTSNYSGTYTGGNGKQIMRIDGKDAFVEVMDSKFSEGKVTLNFSNYDKTQPKGHRQKDFIRFNLTFQEFMNLGHDVLHGNMMNWSPIDSYNNLRPAYMKGVPSKYNNSQAIARRLEIKNGDKQPIRLICSEGQGEEVGPGLIKMVGQAQKRVQVGMSQEAFRSIFLVVPMYIQAYLNNHYDQCVK